MRSILAVHEGAEIQIGNYGVATKERAVLVPDEVADELHASSDGTLLIEVEEAALPPGEERVEVLDEELIEGDN